MHPWRYRWNRLLVWLGLRESAPVLTPELICKIALANLDNNLVVRRCTLGPVSVKAQLGDWHDWKPNG